MYCHSVTSIEVKSRFLLPISVFSILIHLFFINREFGPKVINLKLVLKQVPVILDDRDKNVREEGKKLVVELYRWIGQALKPQLSALKPIQVHRNDCI